MNEPKKQQLQESDQPTMAVAQTHQDHRPSSAQSESNRAARDQVLAQVSPAINLAAAGVSFNSQGRLLLIGAEHRIRIAAAQIGDLSSVTALITEAMPEQIDGEMEAAAELVVDLKPYRLPLASLSGYLGQFDVQVEVAGEPHSLAKLAQGVDCFDLILDLGQQPHLTMELKPAGYLTADDSQQLAQALTEIPALKGGFEKPQYFKIQSDLCAHSGSGMTGCTRCLDVCPADAISVAKGKVQIDAHLCHGAGGCASACPTSAIRYNFPQPGLLLDTLQRSLKVYRQAGGVSPLLLLHDAAQVDRADGQGLAELIGQLPGHCLPLQIEEAGCAGMEVWLSAIALGASGVSLLADEGLPDSVRTLLDSEIETCNRLLQGLQLPARVNLVTSSELIEMSPDRVVSRINPIAQLDLQADKRQQISQAMSHLQQQQSLTQNLAVELALSQSAPFGQVEIDATDCTLCMSCVSICPTKALSAASDRPQLSFTEDDCVQCGLCTQACPESVLSLSPRYLLDPAQRTQPRVLHEEKPFCCISCGTAFATQSVVALMLKKLAGHSMFDSEGLRRLEMCADCRVVDIVKTDPGDDLFAMAKGRPAKEGEINLAQPEPETESDSPQSSDDLEVQP